MTRPLRNVSLVGGASLATRALQAAQYIALAFYLDPGDFGIYAVAAGWASVLLVLQDAGLRLVLLQGGRSFLLRYRDSTVIVAALMGVLIAVMIIGFSFPLSDFYGLPSLQAVLIWIAVAVPAKSATSVYFADLETHRRFGFIASVEVVSALARLIAAVLLARAGLGALSLVIPLLPAYVLELLTTYSARTEYRGSRASMKSASALVRQSLWATAGSSGLLVTRQGDYMVLGAMVSPTILGVYFFSYQIVLQLCTLVGSSVNRVALPSLAAVSNSDEAWLPDALKWSSVTLFATTILAGVVVVLFPIAEEVIWGGEWSSAIGPVQLLLLAAPALTLTGLIDLWIVSKGHFKFWAALNWGRAALVLVVAVIAGHAVGESATSVALVIVVGMGVSAALSLVVVTWRLRLSRQIPLMVGAALALVLPVVALVTAGAVPLGEVVNVGQAATLAGGYALLAALGAALMFRSVGS